MNEASREAVIALMQQTAVAIVKQRERARLHGAEQFPKTSADRAGNAVLEKGLKDFGYQIVSEENIHIIPKHGQAWVVDPLDGTLDFVYGQPDWSIMIALVENLHPIFGVVMAPDRGELWYATIGGGAFYRARDTKDVSITVSNCSNPSQARMLMSRYHPSSHAEQIRQRLGARAIVAGSIGIKLGHIAMGEGDIYWSNAPLGEWDICAPGLILQEAGGMLTDIDGHPITFGSAMRRLPRGVAASNGVLSSLLMRAARDGIY